MRQDYWYHDQGESHQESRNRSQLSTPASRVCEFFQQFLVELQVDDSILIHIPGMYS